VRHFDPSTFETITVDIRDHVAWVTLNRPDALNAFDERMQEEVRTTWRALRVLDDVHAAVLTGAGDRAFCVGIDRSQDMSALDDNENLYRTSNNFMYDDPGDDLGPKSCDLWKPVVCAVNGMCCGGAFYLLAECDVIIAAEHATFFDPHVTYGMAAVYEPMKMAQRMPLGEILRLTLLGNHERMSAATAHRIGLVSEVVPAAELAEASHLGGQRPGSARGTRHGPGAAHDRHVQACPRPGTGSVQLRRPHETADPLTGSDTRGTGFHRSDALALTLVGRELLALRLMGPMT
jgi:enoyl-CoA hydratase/carnithine racemase